MESLLPLLSATLRALLIGLVLILNTSAMAFTSLTLFPEPSGSPFEAFQIIFAGLGIFFMFVLLICKAVGPKGDATNVSYVVLFGLVFLCNFLSAIIMTARARNGVLCHDFSALPASCTVADVVIIFSWISFGAAFIGLLVSYVDGAPRAIRAVNDCYTARKRRNMRLQIQDPPFELRPSRGYKGEVRPEPPKGIAVMPDERPIRPPPRELLRFGAPYTDSVIENWPAYPGPKK